MNFAKTTLQVALGKLATMAQELGNRLYHYREGNRYIFTDGTGWTDGFWPGQLWLAYEATGDPRYRKWAEASRFRFVERLSRPETLDHDVGFLYMPSMRAAYELTGDREARSLTLLAAEHLLNRQRPPGFLLAFNDWPDDTPEFRREKAGKTIIDTLMNLGLLWWASCETGRQDFAKAAERHADCAIRWLLRPDGSTYQTYNFDPDTWEPLGPRVWQGLRDDSCWSRGQAWAIYGFALAFYWTGASRFLDAARQTAAYWMSHVPADLVPYWDFDATSGPRDSSAAAIAASGLLELATLSSDPAEAKCYRNFAIRTLINLGTSYATPPHESGLLRHGCSFYPRGWGVDCTLVYGDYFYMEALMKLCGRTRLHWR